MVAPLYLLRLRKELQQLEKDPIPHIRAAPDPNDWLLWHYVIYDLPDGPYQGGYYWGKLRFPQEYPYKPPAIYMRTPTGRFKTDTKLCLSISDFHPESWNPLWTVGSILQGVLSFMTDTQRTEGSIETSTSEKRRLAAESLGYNCRHLEFRLLFPKFLKVYQQVLLESAQETTEQTRHDSDDALRPRNLLTFGALALLLSVIVAIFSKTES
eukprot:GILJ01006844.1.p1 GENE.GILJ01006844.1~~GILJ01006844.1.p1  ORF type:complete len:211 (-),score=5.47 GILJ01006844.1:269-901(-)